MIATCASNPVPSAIVIVVAFAPVLKIASCPLTFADVIPAFVKFDTLLIAVTTASKSVPPVVTVSLSIVNVSPLVIDVIALPVTVGTVPVQAVVPTLTQLPT